MRSLLTRVPQRVLTHITVGAMAFQVAHFVEHGAQFAYWVAHPTATPWLTPWAEIARDSLSASPATGVELLHLLGNGVFWIGLIAFAALPSGQGQPQLRTAIWLQGAHVLEHVVLTATWVFGGAALGFSTAFGMFEGGALSSYRVVWHFTINLFVTLYAIRPFVRAWRGTLLDYATQEA